MEIRSGWSNYTFAFHDNEKVGPGLLAQIAKKTAVSRTTDDCSDANRALRLSPRRSGPNIRYANYRYTSEWRERDLTSLIGRWTKPLSR
jgi:hypothetical protein